MKKVSVLLIVFLGLFTGCSSTNSIAGNNNGTTLSGSVSVPSGAAYAKTMSEKIFYALNSVIGSIAEAITNQTPWNAATVGIYKIGDYVGELVPLNANTALTDSSGHYSLPNSPQTFTILKATKSGANLYSISYAGSVISGDVNPESAATTQLLMSVAPYIDFNNVDVTVLNSLKQQWESSLTTTFNANPSLVPDFSNQTSVLTFVNNFMSNNFLISGQNLTVFDNLLNNYYSKNLDYQIPTVTISSFGGGTTTDWNSVPVVKSLRVGNNKYPLAGTDLLQVKVAKDSTYLYVYAQTDTAPSTLTGRYKLNVFLGEAYSNQNAWNITYNGSAWVSTTTAGSSTVQHYVGTNYFELRIPLTGLSAINDPSKHLSFSVSALDTNFQLSANAPDIYASDSCITTVKF